MRNLSPEGRAQRLLRRRLRRRRDEPPHERRLAVVRENQVLRRTRHRHVGEAHFVRFRERAFGMKPRPGIATTRYSRPLISRALVPEMSVRSGRELV